MSLLLFDIDGTLLLSGGAGVRAMTRAFEAAFGIRDGFTGIGLAGRTDSYLVARALERAGLENSLEHHQRFRTTYLAMLEEEIHQPGSGRRGVLPGVAPLLNALQTQADLHVALLTGNYEAAAEIKLRHFGLFSYFRWGIFGDQSADRNELGRRALARAYDLVPEPARHPVVVIGDTPHDIACARAIGAAAVAVATGSHSAEELETARADVVLADFSDTMAAVRLLTRAGSR
ncbi:MAG: HAD family hydrolase [Acidobacteriota bacterium]